LSGTNGLNHKTLPPSNAEGSGWFRIVRLERRALLGLAAKNKEPMPSNARRSWAFAPNLSSTTSRRRVNCLRAYGNANNRNDGERSDLAASQE
jgi:hypothetical protein